MPTAQMIVSFISNPSLAARPVPAGGYAYGPVPYGCVRLTTAHHVRMSWCAAVTAADRVRLVHHVGLLVRPSRPSRSPRSQTASIEPSPLSPVDDRPPVDISVTRPGVDLAHPR
ncbi:hypothetical protein GCM10018780_16130 [Streptomyces lanatus]|nr:hypothetical protein GCM10018780_16130 [Streptomyces lanatus]